MHEVRTETIINASIEEVWQLLTDTRNHDISLGDFGATVTGTMAVGERLTITFSSKEGQGFSYRPTVSVFKPMQEVRWGTHLFVSGLFENDHYFLLEPLNEGQTRLVQGETFKGVLVPLIWGRLQGQLEPGFKAMNEALKARAEA